MTSSILPLNIIEQMTAQASQQLNRDVEIEAVHISRIEPFDTVLHEGKVKTVCGSDLRSDAFMGPKLFGDSYVLGRKPVIRIDMKAR